MDNSDGQAIGREGARIEQERAVKNDPVLMSQVDEAEDQTIVAATPPPLTPENNDSIARLLCDSDSLSSSSPMQLAPDSSIRSVLAILTVILSHLLL